MDSVRINPADAERAIGRRLLEIRLGTRWSQMTVAQVINGELGTKISNAYIGEIEAGKRPMRLSEADALCRSLGIDIAMLTGGAEAVRPSVLVAIEVLKAFEHRRQVPDRFPTGRV